MELGQFVEEKNAVVRQADLAGCGGIAAADHAGIADGVVRIAEWPRRQQRLVGLEATQGTVDPRGAEAFRRC